MKKHYYCVCWLFAALLLLASCEVVDLTELHSSDSSQSSKSANAQVLKVNATSTEGTISYPVTVYAFDSDGNYAASQTVQSASSSLSLKLDPGSYRLVALAGTEGVTIAEVENTASVIEIPSQSTTALQMGSANVNIASTSVSAYINMGYMVSGVRFTLSNVPEDATAVSVTVSNVATKMDFTGEPSGSAAVTIPLHETYEYREWASSEVFVMPSTANSTVLTISVTRADNTETYSYTHPSALVMGTPYHFRGAYIESSSGGNSGESKINLSGDFIAATWNDTQIVDFNFGNQDAMPKVVESGYIPPYSIWNGHAVALVDSIDEHTEDLLLYSLAEWTDVNSVKTSATQADSIARNYIEGDISGWRIPSTDEVKKLKTMYDIYGDNLSLSSLIESVGGAPVGYWEEWAGKNNTSYLCEGASRYYDFEKKAQSVYVVSKSNVYRLRLVKTVRYEY